MIIQCPACKTRFSIEIDQFKGNSQPRFHCSRCGHYFAMEESKSSQSNSPGSSAKQVIDEAGGKVSEERFTETGSSLDSPQGQQLDLLSEKAKLSSKTSTSKKELPEVTAEWPDNYGVTPLEADLRGVSPSFSDVMQKRRALSGRPNSQSANPLSESVNSRIPSTWSSYGISSTPPSNIENSLRVLSTSPESPAISQVKMQISDSQLGASDIASNHAKDRSAVANISGVRNNSNLAFEHELDDTEDFSMDSAPSWTSNKSQKQNSTFTDEHSTLEEIKTNAAEVTQAAENFFIDGDGEIYSSDLKLKEFYSSKPSLAFSRETADNSIKDFKLSNSKSPSETSLSNEPAFFSEDDFVNGFLSSSTESPKSIMEQKNREIREIVGNSAQNAENSTKGFSLGIANDAPSSSKYALDNPPAALSKTSTSWAKTFTLVVLLPFVIMAFFFHFVGRSTVALDVFDSLRKIVATQAKSVSPADLEIDRPSGKSVSLQNSRNSLEIRGSLTNRSFSPIGEIVLEALLFDDNNMVVSRTRAFSDNLLTSATSLNNLRKEDIASMLNTRSTPVSTLQVGKQEVFRIVIPDIPANATWFTVKVLSATSKY